VTDDVVRQFRAYLDEQEFDYQTAAQLELDRLTEIADEMEYDEATHAALEALEKQLEAEKARDFEKNLDYIEFEIERDIMTKVWGTEGRYEVTLREDNQAQAAVDLLADLDRYRQILSGKHAIAAVAEPGSRAADGESPFAEEN
jgi:carboxyl-terminal processing protease